MLLNLEYAGPAPAKYTQLVFASLLVLPIIITIKRIWFHPLSKHPGPKLWAASRLPYVISLLRGNLSDDMRKLHEKYGDVVRLAPNELSFACESAWRDIYMHRPGHKETKKDPIWYMAPNDMPQNIVTTTDIHVRARMRRLLAPAFNEEALRNQEPVLQMYADKVVDRLRLLVQQEAPQKGAVINFLDWLNFYAIDIMGDLALGESFYCIDSSAYHPWVRTLHNFFKGMILAAAANLFPPTRYLLRRLIPRRILSKQKQHTDFTNAKVLQRLELKTSRPDFITPFLAELRTAPEKMSLGEIQSTFAILIIAGSESVATTLMGVFFYLAKNEEVQGRLAAVLRARFEREGDITVEATKGIAYLDGVISEALRLCFPVPGGLPRVVPEGGDVYAGHYVPGGTSIAIRPYALFLSPSNFAQPLDFILERWLPLASRPQEFHGDKLSACQPFSVGPTGCIGKPLAWAEMRLLVAKVVWSFELGMVEERPFSWEGLHKMMVVEKKDMWLGVMERGAGKKGE